MTGMLIRRPDEGWHEPSVHGYIDEAHLQGLLAAHPTLIPGVGPNARVCREFRSGIGPADLVVVDLDSGITLVECKLASNPQIRREIIGQVLDYASQLWRMSVDEFDSRWAVRTQESLFVDPDNASDLRELVEAGLATGQFRLVLAVDVINQDLRRIVEYLNLITSPSVAVIAVVYSRTQDDDVEILIPQTYGDQIAEVKATQQGRARPSWAVSDFSDWVAEHDPEGSAALGVLLNEMDAAGFQISGGRAGTPSLNASIDVAGVGRKWPFCFYTYARGACLEVRFEDFKNTPEVAEAFLSAMLLAHVPDLNADLVRERKYAKRPNVLLRALTPEVAHDLVATAKSFADRPSR